MCSERVPILSEANGFVQVMSSEYSSWRSPQRAECFDMSQVHVVVILWFQIFVGKHASDVMRHCQNSRRSFYILLIVLSALMSLVYVGVNLWFHLFRCLLCTSGHQNPCDKVHLIVPRGLICHMSALHKRSDSAYFGRWPTRDVTF